MKKSKHFIIPLFAVILSSCSLVKGLEHNLTIAIRNNGELYFSGVVNEFNNVILPKMDEKYIEEGMKFAGYTYDHHWTIDDGLEALHKAGSLLRYKEVKDYAYNGGVELFSQFVTKDTPLVPQHYVTLGWYNKPATSGLDTNIAEKIQKNVAAYLKEKGASETDLSDFVFKGYTGNVGQIGTSINEDGYVDVFIGAAANLKSTGGVDYVERTQASKNYGAASNRYVYLLHDKPAARLVYEYCLSDAFYSVFE